MSATTVWARRLRWLVIACLVAAAVGLVAALVSITNAAHYLSEDTLVMGVTLVRRGTEHLLFAVVMVCVAGVGHGVSLRLAHRTTTESEAREAALRSA